MSRPSRAHARRARRHSAAFLPALLVVALVTISTAALAIWRPWQDEGSPQEDTATSPAPEDTVPAGTPTADESPTPEPEPLPDAEFVIVGGGDMLIHESIYNAAWNGSDYDFVPLMEATADYTRGADLALCNLEVPLTPPGMQPSGYPMFASPSELAGDLADLGWDGCSTATNHSLDRGMPALTHTLDALDEAAVGHAGTARGQEEADQAQFYELERQGQTVTVAQIAATYGTNGIPVPADAPWAVQLIDTDQLIEQATQARDQGADLVVASIHCCTEYDTDPHPDQVRIAEELAASGQVDLVLGHHAHVPQPIERLDGGPEGEGMWVAYGLGNFISGQDENCCRSETATGLLAYFHVVKPDGDGARIESAEWTAVTMDRLGGSTLHVLADLVAGQRPDGLTLTEARITQRYQEILAIVGDGPASERTEPPSYEEDPARVVPRAGTSGD